MAKEEKLSLVRKVQLIENENYKKINLYPRSHYSAVFNRNGERLDLLIEAIKFLKGTNDISIDDYFVKQDSAYSSEKIDYLVKELRKKIIANSVINGLEFQLTEKGELQIIYDDGIDPVDEQIVAN